MSGNTVHFIYTTQFSRIGKTNVSSGRIKALNLHRRSGIISGGRHYQEMSSKWVQFMSIYELTIKSDLLSNISYTILAALILNDSEIREPPVSNVCDPEGSQHLASRWVLDRDERVSPQALTHWLTKRAVRIQENPQEVDIFKTVFQERMQNMSGSS